MQVLRNRHYWILLGILLVAAWLRFVGLGHKCLWNDEALSWRLVTFPSVELIARTGQERTVHPPLYFLCLRFLTIFAGDSEFAMRSFSAVCGILTVFGTYWLIRALEPFSSPAVLQQTRPSLRWAALLATALVALSILQIHAAKQVRNYSLGSLLTVCSGWALLHALAAQKRAGGYWCGYLLSALALCYTHYVGLFTVTAQLAFGWSYLRFRHRTPVVLPSQAAPQSASLGVPTATSSCLPTAQYQSRWMLVVSLGILLGYLCWVPQLVGQAVGTNKSWRSPLTPDALPEQTGTALCSTFATFEVPDPVVGWIVTAGLLATMGFLVVRCTWADWFLVATGLLPVVLILLYTLLTDNNLYHARYLSFAQLSWLASIAVAICALRPIVSTFLACQLLVFGILCWSNTWELLGPAANSGMRGAAEHIRQHRKTGEPIVALSPFDFYKSAYYLQGDAPPLLCVSTLPRGISSHQKREDLTTPDLLLNARDFPGIWLMSSRSYNPGLIVRFPLPANWKLVHGVEFEQDYPRELPILVEYYQVENESAENP